jgi:membrane protein implicated in regulation of membrane protease activity
MREDVRTYIVAQLPGWILAAVALTALSKWMALPGWLAPGFLVVWIIKDLLLFPTMRRYYRSEPARQRMVGQRGTAVTAIAPNGFVRVNGELWQAESTRHLAEGSNVVVRGIQGLQLRVAPEERGPHIAGDVDARQHSMPGSDRPGHRHS